jgi:hypothetical protein
MMSAESVGIVPPVQQENSSSSGGRKTSFDLRAQSFVSAIISRSSYRQYLVPPACMSCMSTIDAARRCDIDS